jgi:hypothetical protein
MARIVVQCQYSRHFILTGVDSRAAPIIAGGRIRCPYCDTDHTWTCDTRSDQHESNRTPPRTMIRQAS